jgi:hypothetical protein
MTRDQRCGHLLVVAALSVLGCGGTASLPADVGEEVSPSGETNRLCDGRQGEVFAFTRVAGASRGQTVVIENGFAFLHITGDCKFWAFTGSRLGGVDSHALDIKTGELTREEESALDRELQLALWAGHAGKSYSGGISDATPDKLWRQGKTITCDALCFWNKEHPELNRIYNDVLNRLYSLADRGRSMEGDVRISVLPMGASYPDWTGEWAQWPLEEPMATVTWTSMQAEPPGSGHLVRQPAADLLRAIRRESARGKFGNFSFIPVRERPGSPIHALQVRDTVPLEGPNGLIPPP